MSTELVLQFSVQVAVTLSKIHASFQFSLLLQSLCCLKQSCPLFEADTTSDPVQYVFRSKPALAHLLFIVVSSRWTTRQTRCLKKTDDCVRPFSVFYHSHSIPLLPWEKQQRNKIESYISVIHGYFLNDLKEFASNFFLHFRFSSSIFSSPPAPILRVGAKFCPDLILHVDMEVFLRFTPSQQQQKYE